MPTKIQDPGTFTPGLHNLRPPADAPPDTGAATPQDSAAAADALSRHPDGERLKRNPVIQRMLENQQGGGPASDPAGQPAGQPTGHPAAPRGGDEPLQPRKIKVKFRHQEVELDEKDAQTYIQKGMSAQKLEERRAQIEAQARENDKRLEFATHMERLAQADPTRFQAAMDILLTGGSPLVSQGRAAATQEPDDDGLTPEHQAPNVSALERRLAALEARNQQVERSFHQRDHESRMQTALNSREYLRDNPEAGEIARRLLENALALGDVDSPEEGAPLIEAQVKRLVQGHVQAEQRRLTQQREAGVPRSAPASVELPRLDRNVVRDFRKPEGRAALARWMDSVRQVVRGTNRNV